MSSPLQILASKHIVDRTVNDVSDRYTVGDMLGEGRFSQVYSATRGKSLTVALKVVEMATLEEDEEAVEALVQEVTALRKAHAAAGRSVPKVHEVLQTADTIYVVMDQVKGCELFEMLSEGPLSEISARRLIAQLLSALANLHKSHVVHRDVKPENIMVSDVDDPSRCRLVLIDFGYAAIGTKENEPLDGLAGSPEYAAPEVLSWLDGDGLPYYKSCDMWSVGVTAYVLLTGELPFTFPEESSLEEHVRTTTVEFGQSVWDIPVGADGFKEMFAARAFIKSCMCVEEKRRPTAKQALGHKWFNPRADDKEEGVSMRASKSSLAALQRRLGGGAVAVTDAPRNVIRWFGRLATGSYRSPAKAVTKQQFWELKLGMPPRPEEQSAPADATPRSPASTDATPQSPLSLKSGESATAASSKPVMPLNVKPLAQLNGQEPPAYLASARKSIALESDRMEEASIKKALGLGSHGGTPRSGPFLWLGGPTAPGEENRSSNSPPLPSPRRALFLAPSPRNSGAAALFGAMPRPPPVAVPNTPVQAPAPAAFVIQQPGRPGPPVVQQAEMEA